MKNKIKAIALLSGGLDSILAARIIADQGIEVTGIYFSSPFWSNEEKEKIFIKEVEEQNNFKIIIKQVGDEYLEIVKNPLHGWGKNINPCIDCKIFMLKKAKEMMESSGANFIVTGEVIGQRPMSQHKGALNLILKETGLDGLLVRPLCAKNLPATIPEDKGWIERVKLYDAAGRSRKVQFMLAKKFKIDKFTSPAGGCLLTEKKFAPKLMDLFKHNENPTMHDVELLKYGRHFRYKNNKIIVGRNKIENNILQIKKNNNDYEFEVPDCGSPVTILQGDKNNDSIILSAQLTALYSDNNENKVQVKYKDEKNIINYINIDQINKEDVLKYNLAK